MRRIALCLTLVLSLAPVVFSQQQKVDIVAPKLEHFDPDMVDRSLDPCTDFHKFTCNKFFVENPIPGDQVAWGKSSPLLLWNETIQKETMEKAAAKSAARTAVEQKIGDYWAACMDESAIQNSAQKALAAEVKRIDAIKDKAGLVDAIAHLHSSIPGAWQATDTETFAAAFGFGSSQDYDDATKVIAMIDQGGMALPGREFYLEEDAKSKEIRAKYVTHVTNLLKLSGEKPEQAAADAKNILEMETAMARAAMDVVKRRDPKNINNKMTMAQIRTLAPSFDFARYVKLVNAPAVENYIVTSPEYFKGFNQLVEQRPLEQWKAYLRWHLVHGAAPYLSKPFVDENFAFFRQTLFGAKQQLPRWRRCVRYADRDLGEALGQAYVDRAFAGDSKERVLKLVDSIERALGRNIDTLNWMTPETKKQAKAKLDAILDKIGYPDQWRDYSSVSIKRESLLGNVETATQFEFQRQLNKIGKPVNRGEWNMTPPTINAYYDPQMNTINFPAGILQPPYFDLSKDDAVNYGAIGGVIGHEIIHGFDDQGRKFDGNGNLRDWWTEADAKAYDQRGKCISDEYTQEVPEAGVKQNGLLTQGEDTADNGGIYLALLALEDTLKQQEKSLDDKSEDGWTPLQRFFLSYANGWCSEYRPELLRTVVLTDPHSMPKYRVNNVVSNMPEFQKAFGCKAGQPMVRANACRVW